MEKKVIHKIVLAGDGGVGKSSFLATKSSGEFSYSSKITIGIDFTCLLVEGHSQSISFLIYDLGGQKRFHFLHDAYLKGAKAAIIMYDVTRNKSFEDIPQWLNLMLQEDATIPILLVGSKIDLAQQEDLLFYTAEWRKMEGVIPGHANVKAHMFISSKDLIGLDELFSRLTAQFLVQPECVY